MDASLSFENAAVSLTTQPAWFTQADMRTAAWWAQEQGFLQLDRRAPTATLTIANERYEALGRGPDSDEPEAVDAWSFAHEAVAKLLNLRRETLSVQPRGFVGGPRMQLIASVNGTEIDLARSEPPKFEDARGQPVVLSPVLCAALRPLVAFAQQEQHAKAEQLAVIAELKRLRQLQSLLGGDGARVRIELDEHLDSFDIIEPERFSLAWSDDGRSRVSLKLYVQGESEPLPLENLDAHAPIIQRSSRETVALDPGTATVARRARELQQVRRQRVGEDVLRDPLALIPEGVETPRLDLSEYGHRLLGFAPTKQDASGMALSSGTAWYRRDDDGQGRIFLTATSPQGERVELAFDNASEAGALAADLEQAISRGQGALTVQGHTIQVAPELSDHLRELVRQHYPEPEAPNPDEADAAIDQANTSRSRTPTLRPVLADVESKPDEDAEAAHDIEDMAPWPELQRVLAPNVSLKPHQRLGIAWLWHRYQSGASGALLADDMGLGKTLQIASFIALAKLAPRTQRAKRPTLIVAPVVLIENWYEELIKFFQGPFPGRVQQLRDERLRGLRQDNGELDGVQLTTFDIVITSYETLARHATSLLKIDWDVVVLDEAHRIKNRGTQWSIAARGLSGLADLDRPRKFDFGICATGTPVENAVTDLWAIYDFVSPGSPFTSYEAFRQRYAAHEDAPRLLSQQLKVGSLSSSLLRRDKADVLSDFPPKTYQTIPIPMSYAQRDLERTLAKNAWGKGAKTFKILESLQKLYQHPWLLRDEAEHSGASHQEAIAASPKLASCIGLLEQIRDKGEKALVFTLWVRMQWLLKDVFEARLGLSDVPILNGDPKNRKRTQEHIRAFSDTPGFAVMILSPLAAGVGLNITAANHVIHYGRWWNPAKEDQATDRAYRIGQHRPVQVYYPVLHHPDDPEQGFDVKLHELVSRKRDMARQLLEPADHQDLSEDELRAVCAVGTEGH